MPKVRAVDLKPQTNETPLVLYQIISLAGAFLVLVAYLAANRDWLGPRDPASNLLNLVGGLLLFWVAVVDRRAGFMVLELTWALIAIPPLLWPKKPTAQGG